MRKFTYQNLKTTNYFEGWYFRFTSDINYAVIFAITKNEKEPHAFIQVFNESMNQCIYKKYDISLFSFSNNEVHIGNNILSLKKLYVNVDDFKLDLEFSNKKRLEKSAMGYLEKAPLDCFQEVIILDGDAKGRYNTKSTEGKIYIEKTYGNKFPVKWIWLQSNHSENNSSLSFSVGYIPLLKRQIKGWLLILKTNDKLLSFHSFDGSSLKIKDKQLIIRSLRYKVVIDYELSNTIKIVGPAEKAEMLLEVFESLTSTASVEVYYKKKLIFNDSYINVGLEHMMK